MAGVVHGAKVQLIRARLADSIRIKQEMLESERMGLAVAVADQIVESFTRGGKVIFFGNGGSSMDAGHLAAELLGKYYLDRPPLAAISLADNTAALTAIGNDYSFGEVFARQVRGIGKASDVLIGLSTSGNSVNVLQALQAGKELGMFTVALTGADGGMVGSVVDVCIRIPTADTPRVQEACMHLGHSICELVEATLFGQGSTAL